jgi:hypothetical protein
MKQCTIIGHNGWTDYISQYALRRHFIQPFDKVILFIDSIDKYDFVRTLYPDDHIEVCVPITNSNYDGINSCICCHTLGSPIICPRTRAKCKFIDYSKYPDSTHIKLNAFDNYEKWDAFFQGKSFLDSMYKYYNLDFIKTSLQYKLPIHLEKNQHFFTALNIPCDYAILHDNKSIGLSIQSRIDYPVIEFNGISNSIVDTIFTLQKAKEIHCIDSVYFFLILLLSIQYGYFKDIPVYLYYRSIDSNGPFQAVKQFVPSNWIIRSL